MGDTPIFGTLGVLAGMALTLGVAAYLVLRVSRNVPELVPAAAKRLVRALLFLTALIVVGLVIWLGVRVTNLKTADEPQPAAVQFRVHIDFSVPEVVEHQSVSTYRVSGGSINVGCNESIPSRVSFPSPPGATIQTATATWENLDGVVGHNEQASFDSHLATAVGQIQGRGRSIFGDCSGGGHGELVLSGALSTKRSEATGNRSLIKTADETFASNGVLGVAVPDQVKNVPLQVVITPIDTPGAQKFVGTISVGADGKLMLSPMTTAESTLDISMQANVMLIKLVAHTKKS